MVHHRRFSDSPGRSDITKHTSKCGQLLGPVRHKHDDVKVIPYDPWDAVHQGACCSWQGWQEWEWRLQECKKCKNAKTTKQSSLKYMLKSLISSYFNFSWCNFFKGTHTEAKQLARSDGMIRSSGIWQPQWLVFTPANLELAVGHKCAGLQPQTPKMFGWWDVHVSKFQSAIT